MSLTIAPPAPPAGPPPVAHPVVRFLDSLSGALDRLADAPLWSMTPEEQRHALVAMRAQRARSEELELRMLAQADRDRVGRISAGEDRRPACKAAIIPMVLDGDSMPLDIGREQRQFTRYQKLTINQRHHGCAVEGCDRPPAWMEYHHDTPWALGGNTDTNHGTSYCPPHHHMADHPETHDHTRLPNGNVRFTRHQ